MTTKIELSEQIIHGDQIVQQIHTRIVLPEEGGIHETPIGPIEVDYTGMQGVRYPRELQLTGQIFGSEPVMLPMYDDIYGPSVGMVELPSNKIVRVEIGE